MMIRTDTNGLLPTYGFLHNTDHKSITDAKFPFWINVMRVERP